MKYDLKKIMLNAWKNYRKQDISFAEALHRAWLSAKAEEINAERIEMSKEAAGVTEETNTWAGWKKLGYEVIHGSRALFGCSLIWGSKGDGAVYNARFFGDHRYKKQYKEKALISAATPIGAVYDWIPANNYNYHSMESGERTREKWPTR